MGDFDTKKGAFILVAIVIATLMAVVLISIASCAFVMLTGMRGGVCTSLQDFIRELISMSFTAAVAFAGGRLSAPKVPQPKIPEESGDDPEKQK